LWLLEEVLDVVVVMLAVAVVLVVY